MSTDAAVFCQEMLLKTSRTFSVSIPILPSPLDDIVGVGYLLCRVADTIEDEGDVAAPIRAELLRELPTLVALPADWQESSAAFAERACRLLAAGAPAHELSLMAGLPILLGDLADRPRPVRELVHTCVRDMTTGMAKVVLRCATGPDQPVIGDTDALLEYCDIVAGTVGRMLTGLFAWHSAETAAVLNQLEPRADAFGRVLQLTNIIKDVSLDSAAGRSWLPRSVLADCGVDTLTRLRDPGCAVRRGAVLQQMLAITQREFIDAQVYLDALPVGEVAIRRFCVAQLLMGQLTLRKAWKSPEAFSTAPIKISRRSVKLALATTYVVAARPAVLDALFGALRATLPAPVTELPPRPVCERTLDDAINAAVARLATTPLRAWHDGCGSVADTAFAVQALVASGDCAVREPLRSASRFLAGNQRITAVREAKRFFVGRGNRGGGGLSGGGRGATTSVGTAEVLLAVLALDELGLADGFTSDRLDAAAKYVLSLQNPDGGWSASGRVIASRWLGRSNVSNIFGARVLGCSEFEASASCIAALRRYRIVRPALLRRPIDRAIARGEQFLLDSQRPDGSWEGVWAGCFTLSTWLGIRGLAGSTDPHVMRAIDRGCAFLLAHQRSDGGWGESIEVARVNRYIHTATSQAVMTSWALLGLVAAGRADSPVVLRAIGFLLRSQLSDGGWHDEQLHGAPQQTTVMNYDVYQWIFPLWALSAALQSSPAMCDPTSAGRRWAGENRRLG